MDREGVWENIFVSGMGGVIGFLLKKRKLGGKKPILA